MPEIVLLDSSDDENDELTLETLKIDNDVSRFHPASFNQVFPERSLEPYINHPAAVRVPIRKAKVANRLKEMGNEKFKTREYFDAYDLYTDALEYAPEDDTFASSRAVFLNNRAACSIMVNHYEEAIEDTSVAIKLDPKYVKAYMRRAQAYEKMDDLDAALSDINKALEIDPRYAPALKEHARIEPIVREKNEKLKDEMMGKLKDLGNSILGKFGMSLDNFQAVQDPNTGSYSISYNPGK